MKQRRPETKVSELAVTWALVVPLIFFAVSGAVRFDSSFKNNLLSSALQTDAVDIRKRVTQFIALSICLLVCSSELPAIRRSLLQNKAFFALFALALMSTMWSIAPVLSLLNATYVMINILLAAYLIIRFSCIQQKQIFVIVGWIAVLSSIAVAVMYPAYGVDQRGMRHAGDWLGIFIHKNDCAVMVTYLLSAAIFSSSRGGVAKSLRLAYILLSIFLIVMTQSRTGWVATTCLLMFAGAIKIMRRFTGRERVALSLIGLCIIMCLAISVSQYSTAILAVLGKDSTVSGRTDIFKNVFGSIIKHPVLGYGYMAFFNGGGGESSDVSLYSRVVLPTVDNGYLGVWLDLGGIGLGLFALTLIRAIRDAIYCFRNNMASDINWYVSIIVLAVVSNTAERMIMIPNYLAWIMYVMACMGLNTEARGIRSQSKIIMVNDTV